VVATKQRGPCIADRAGVATVIASQWPVDDVSTSLLMSKLYQEWLGGAGIADALQTARHWLRSLTQDELATHGQALFRWISAPRGPTFRVALLLGLLHLPRSCVVDRWCHRHVLKERSYSFMISNARRLPRSRVATGGDLPDDARSVKLLSASLTASAEHRWPHAPSRHSHRFMR